VSQSAVTTLEQRERAGTVTMASLARVANALDCDVAYALVPRRGLQTTVERQARAVARSQIARVAHTMALEQQGVSSGESAEQERELSERLLYDMPRSLWNDGETPGTIPSSA